MIPVYQTKFGAKVGNCFKASVASILERELDEIPDIKVDKNWLIEINDFLSTKGYAFIWLDINQTHFWFGDCFCVLAGRNEQNLFHAVVGYHYIDRETQEHNYKVAHNPNYKEKSDLVSMDRAGFFISTMLK